MTHLTASDRPTGWVLPLLSIGGFPFAYQWVGLRLFGIMSKKPSYSEKLKDPRWQKRRLEIMDRAGFACEICESEDNTLCVHHKYYEAGKEPWEYPNEALLCVCNACHKEAAEIERSLLQAFPGCYYTKNEIHLLSAALFRFMSAGASLGSIIRFIITETDLIEKEMLEEMARKTKGA